MSRLWIVDGDTTDHGGRVTARDSIITIGGCRVASVGDEVHCPKCNVVATIVEGRQGATMNGRRVASVGDLTSCGARLISIRQEFVDFGDQAAHAAAPLPTMSAPAEPEGDAVCEACLDEAAARGAGLIER